MPFWSLFSVRVFIRVFILSLRCYDPNDVEADGVILCDVCDNGKPRSGLAKSSMPAKGIWKRLSKAIPESLVPTRGITSPLSHWPLYIFWSSISLYQDCPLNRILDLILFTDALRRIRPKAEKFSVRIPENGWESLRYSQNFSVFPPKELL